MVDYRNPLELLNELKAIPDLSTWVDRTVEYIENKGLRTYSRSCFLPLSGWLAIVQQARPELDLADRCCVAAFLGAVGTWRYSQGIYKFDADLYKELLNSESGGKLPTDVLTRLPEWSVYLETPDLFYDGQECYGVFVHLSDDPVDGVCELRLYAITENMSFNAPSPEGYLAFSIHLKEDITLDQAYDLWYDRIKENAAGVEIPDEQQYYKDLKADRAENVGFIKKIINLVLYICSEEPEIVDRKTPDWLPTFPHPKKTKGRLRFFPAKRPHFYDVGKNLGEELRKAKEAIPAPATGRTVVSHLRRAHWHSFWTGKRNPGRETEQKLIVKWLPPIFVHGSKGE